jgi:dCTP deaminase
MSDRRAWTARERDRLREGQETDAHHSGGRDLSILSGKEIIREHHLGHVEIDPFDEANVGPNSYDVHLAPTLRVYVSFPLDERQDNPTEELTVPERGLVLEPGVLYLGSTVERIGSRKYVTDLDGVSSKGRLGVSIHQTAGRGETGWLWRWTLEITVVHPVRIYPRCRIAQARFAAVVGTVTQYAGRYRHQQGPTASRSWQDHQSQQEPPL